MSRRLCAALASLVAVASAIAPNIASADHCTDASLRNLLVDDSELPPGYVLQRESSGRIDLAAEVGRELSDVEESQLHCGYTQEWLNEESATIVTTRVFELRSGAAAAELLREIAAVRDEVFDVPQVKGRGFVQDLALPNTGEVVAEEVWVLFRRGRYLYSVGLASEVADVPEAREIASLQAEKAPSGASSAAEPFSAERFMGEMVGIVFGFVVLYLAAAAFIAGTKDKSRAGAVLPSRANARGLTPDDGVIDVSNVASRGRFRARLLFAVQVLGLSIFVPGLVPAFWPGALIAVAIGLALICAPTVLRRRGRARSGDREIATGRMFSGRRSLRVSVYYAAGLLLLVGAAMLAALAAVSRARDASVLVTSSGGENTEISSLVLTLPQVLVAVALAAAGVACYRRGRRLAALDARVLTEQDPRPIVLYLRSFTDDAIKIRAAVIGRRSLLEQLSPGRFDRFEELLTWELNRTGPVVALNPPGTSLAPIGAARTTLGNDVWQSTIAEWMSQAALIVVNAPPREPTEGLRWELQRIHERGLWSKTVIVCPPVGANDLRQRWDRFLPLLRDLGIVEAELPVDPAAVVVASVTPDGKWLVALAKDRTEWSYVAALRAFRSRDQGGVGAVTPVA